MKKKQDKKGMRLLNKLFIKFFNKKRNSESKTVFYHLEEDRFYLREPKKGINHKFVEITRWCNRSAKQGLWVNIVSGDHYVILDSKVIKALAKQLSFLENVKDERWDNKIKKLKE